MSQPTAERMATIIAERVMGWHLITPPHWTANSRIWADAQGKYVFKESTKRRWSPAGNRDHAMLAIEAAGEKHGLIFCIAPPNQRTQGWSVDYERHVSLDEDDYGEGVHASLPMALCLALCRAFAPEIFEEESCQTM